MPEVPKPGLPSLLDTGLAQNNDASPFHRCLAFRAASAQKRGSILNPLVVLDRVHDDGLHLSEAEVTIALNREKCLLLGMLVDVERCHHREQCGR